MKPDYNVVMSIQYGQDENRRPLYRNRVIGAAWVKTDKNGQQFISCVIDALPVTGKITLFAPKDTPSGEEPADGAGE